MDERKDPIEEIERSAAELEADTGSEDVNQHRDSQYFELMARAEQQGAAELAQRLRFEGLALSYPGLTTKIPPAALDYYSKRLEKVTNPIYRACYGRILWDFRHGEKPYKYAQVAIEGYLDSASTFRTHGWYSSLMTALPQALSLATKLNKSESVGRSRDEMIDVVRQFDKTQDYRWIIEHLEALFSEDSVGFSESESSEIEQIIKRAISSYYYDPYMERVMRNLLIRFYAKQKDETAALGARRDAAMLLERSGDEARPIARLAFYRKAAKAFQEFGMTADLNRIKVKLKAAAADSTTSMKTHSGSVEIDRKMVEDLVNALLDDDLKTALSNLAFSDLLIPNVEENEKLAEQLSQNFVFASLVQPILLRNNNIIAAPVTRDGVERHRFVEEYDFAMQYIAVVYLEPIFRGLVEEYELDAEKLVDFLRGGVIDDDKLEVLRVGFERFLAGDYVSAMHVLTPHLEDTLRRLIGKLNLPTTALRAGITFHEISLEQVLGTLSQQKVFQPNLIEYLRVFLCEQSSDNLRNRIAHGLVSLNECDRRRGIILLHMFIILGGFTLNAAAEPVTDQPE